MSAGDDSHSGLTVAIVGVRIRTFNRQVGHGIANSRAMKEGYPHIYGAQNLDPRVRIRSASEAMTR